MKKFVTTEGIAIEYGPIALNDLQLAQNAVEKEFRDRGEPIDPPTYEVDVLGGEKEYHPHTAETIKDASEEEKEAWRLHLDAVKRMQDEIEARTSIIFLDAIKVQLPEDEKWIRRRKKLFGEDVPEDEDERLLYYVNNVLLKTPRDSNELMNDIFEYSMEGAPQEVTQAYKDLFRREVEKQGRQITKLIETIQGTNEEVVLQSVDAAGTSSEGMGDVAKSIPKPAGKRQGGANSPV